MVSFIQLVSLHFVDVYSMLRHSKCRLSSCRKLTIDALSCKIYALTHFWPYALNGNMHTEPAQCTVQAT